MTHDTCPRCNNPSRGLYLTTAGLVCFDCVPAKDKNRYPDWEAQHNLTERRREIALKNFHSDKTLASQQSGA